MQPLNRNKSVTAEGPTPWGLIQDSWLEVGVLSGLMEEEWQVLSGSPPTFTQHHQPCLAVRLRHFQIPLLKPGSKGLWHLPGA